MTETKNEAFHRLAGKRIEGIEDALRVFSNLSGPSYDFTQEELHAYTDRVTGALRVAMTRFEEARGWEGAPVPPVPPVPPVEVYSSRMEHMLKVFTETDGRLETAIEHSAMQKEVIDYLQNRIDELTAPKS